MPTLILTPRFTDDAQALWRAASDLGWDIRRLATWRVPEDILGVPDPVLYLEGLFGPTLAEEFGLQLIEPPVDWLPRLPNEYRKRRVYLTTLEEARTSVVKPTFIKPPNDKSFAAGIYAGKDLPGEFDGTSLVLVSELVQWEKEFRCFVLDREPRTISIYLRDGELQRDNDFSQEPGEEHEALAFVRVILADPRVELGRTAVLDVGVMEQGWAVVEQNAAWGSGIYGCDPVQVLEVLRYSAEPRRMC